MSTEEVGRNDPCPCGSGKKYKHCCMRKGRRRRGARAPSPASQQDRAHSGQLDRVRYMIEELIPQVPPDRAQALQETLETAEEMAAYEAMGDEIEAATQVLEAHRAEFEKMMGDAEAAMGQAQRLFSEERFASMRYTADDVHRAFEAVGYPARYWEEASKEDMETFVAAIVHVADDEAHRLHLARQLLMMLPEYVSAGRYLDAWLIQYSAFRMTEVPDKSNPFLFEMFHHGFDEWGRQLEEQQRALMRELDIDVSELAKMSVQEADAWVRAQMADPAKGALLKAYYEAHPMMRDQAQAEMMELERDSLRLLERDDADCLYLSPEEISPWVPVLMERLEPVEAQARKAAEGEDQDDAGTLEAVGKIMVEVAQEMVPAVFTPERFDQLVGDLKEYWSDLLEKQEEEAARLAHLASIMLEEKDEVPVEDPLLIGMCFASLRLAMIVLSEEAQARAESGAGVE